MFRKLYLYLFIVVSISNCSPKNEDPLVEDSATKEILSPEMKNRLRAIKKWSSETETLARKVLSSEDVITRLIGVKRVSKWPWKRKVNILKSLLKNESSPLIKEEIFKVLWRDNNLSSETTHSLIILSFDLLKDHHEKIFSIALQKIEKKFTTKYRPQLRDAISKVSKKRKPILFAILCKKQITKKDAEFIAKNGDNLGAALKLCRKRVTAGLKTKFR